MSINQINIFYELTIAPGKASEVRRLAKEMVASNLAGEPGTLVYNVYINCDESLLTFWETHADSQASLHHGDRFANGTYVAQMMTCTEGARLCLYGNVSEELKQWVTDNGFQVEYHERIDGFVR
jgi:quinol monooxygenase YgiN